MITLAVQDLEKAVRFYRDGLVLPTEGIVGQELEHGAVAFFDLEAGLKLAGCYAVGDAVTGLNQIAVAMAHGEIAAVDIHNSMRRAENLCLTE